MKDQALRKHLDFVEFDKSGGYYGNSSYKPVSIITQLKNQITQMEMKYSDFMQNYHELHGKYSTLKNKFETLEAKLFESCTYCGVKVPKGETYETGEKKTLMDVGTGFGRIYEREIKQKACDSCLKELQKKCEAAKTGYANKVKKVK